jgi:hypothetical protein
MTDCSNADIRDRLPDLLHERLDATMRAVVVAHVAECVECRDELELLRGVHKTLIARTPRVDIGYIVGALPKAPAPRPQIRPAVPATRRWSDWRIAAAVTVLVAGGSSLAVLRRGPSAADTRAQITDSTPTRSFARVAPESGAASAMPSAGLPSSATPVASVAALDDGAEDVVDGRFGGLSPEQMQALLGEIDKLQAVPVTEPEPVTIRVDLNPSGTEEPR